MAIVAALQPRGLAVRGELTDVGWSWKVLEPLNSQTVISSSNTSFVLPSTGWWEITVVTPIYARISVDNISLSMDPGVRVFHLNVVNAREVSIGATTPAEHVGGEITATARFI